MLIEAVLVQDQFRRSSTAVGDERNLRVDDFVEVVAITFGEHLEARLSRRLREQMIPLPTDANDEARRQLVAPA